MRNTPEDYRMEICGLSTVSCSYSFTLPPTVCEETGFLRVCLDNAPSGFHYTWSVIGPQSSQFVMNGNQTGNMTTGQDLTCLILYSFPNYAYYPQTIEIEVFSPNLGSSYIVRRRIQIVDCNNDDPTCDEYYDFQSEELVYSPVSSFAPSSTSPVHNSIFDMAKYGDGISRIEVYDILGRRLYSGLPDNYVQLTRNDSVFNNAMIFIALFDDQNRLIGLIKTIDIHE